MDQPRAVDYHDVLLRNGFTEGPHIISGSRSNAISLYTRISKQDENVDIIEVETYNDHWKLRYKDQYFRLEALVRSKSFHDSDQDHNDDVNHKSLLNLHQAFVELQIPLILV
jgi:hypothetical protein